MMLRLPCAIVESPWRHRHVRFVNIAYLRSRSIKRRQWKHNLDYYGVVFAHLATRCGIKAKSSRDSRATSQRDSSIWIQPLRVFHYSCPQADVTHPGGGGSHHRFSQKWQIRVCKWNFRMCKMPLLMKISMKMKELWQFWSVQIA